MMHVALVWLFSCLAAGFSQQSADGGSPECPCISSSSGDWSRAMEAVEHMSLLGVNSTYGLMGCAPYDQGWTSFFATCDVADPPAHCGIEWCYIDEELCAATAQCEGTVFQPNCRDRPRELSVAYPMYINYPLRLSYETCGSLKSHSPAEINARSTGWTFALTSMTSRPYSFFNATGDPTGIIPDLITSSIPRLHSDYLYRDGVSADSLSRYSYSWDACIHDVGLGYTDMCFGDFWVSQARLLHASFLPSLYQDNFWLVVRLEEEPTLLQMLGKPFEPFKGELWGICVLFLLGSGILLAFAEREQNDDDFPDTRTCWSMLKGVYIAFMSYFSGGPINGPQTVAGRLITMGIAFFVLLALASYTANLTTFLISSKLRKGIPNLAVALSQGHIVAMSSLPFDLLRREHPDLEAQALVVPFGAEAKMIYSGQADLAVIPDSTLANMYAGNTVLADCAGGAAPGESESDFRKYCPLNDEGELNTRRDCILTSVGKPLASVNVAVPVAKHHQAAVAWAVEAVLAEGYDATLTRKYSAWIPADNALCIPGQTTVGVADPLGPTALLGSLLVSIFLVGAGAVFAIVGCIYKWLGLDKKAEEAFQRVSSETLQRVSSLQHSAVFGFRVSPATEDISPKFLESGAVVPDTIGRTGPAESTHEQHEREIARLEAHIQTVFHELNLALKVEKQQAEITRLQKELALVRTLKAPPPDSPRREWGALVQQWREMMPTIEKVLRETREATHRISVYKTAERLQVEEIYERIDEMARSVQEVADVQWRLGISLEMREPLPSEP